VNAGEMINPRKNLPFALIFAAVVVVVFYCLIQFVSIAVLPTLGGSEKPLADAAALMMGKAGGLLITVGAGISIAGTLNAIMLSGSRVSFALSEQNQFPKFLAWVHPGYRTPSWSILFFAIIVSIVSIAWSFMSALNVAVIIRLVMYSSVCAALIKLRKKREAKNYFKLRYGIAMAIAGVVLTICLLTSSKWKEILDFLIWLGAGLLLFGVINVVKKK
jgi:amino acid transporter